MATSIRECGVDAEIRDLLPAHSWQESAELGASVERFGYLAPIIAWRNPAGELIVLDGHKRRELWLAACGAAQKSGGSIPAAPQVTELPFDSRDAAMLFVLDNATGRRNLSDVDWIKLAAKREEIVRRMAKSNQETRTDLSVLLPKGSISTDLDALADRRRIPVVPFRRARLEVSGCKCSNEFVWRGGSRSRIKPLV